MTIKKHQQLHSKCWHHQPLTVTNGQGFWQYNQGTICLRYNVPRYIVDIVITRPILAPEI